MTTFNSLAFVLALTATTAAAGCGASVDAIEEVPPGSEVAISTNDGRIIEGELVRVTEDQVVVATDQSGDVTVTRDVIVTATRTDDAPGIVSDWFTTEPDTFELQVPEGTKVLVTLETPVSSKMSSIEDRVRAIVREPVMMDGHVAVPEGSEMIGEVVDARPSGEVKGRARLSIRFTRLDTRGDRYDIVTRPLTYEAQGTKKEDAVKIGIGAAAGAIIGGLADGGKGAAIGTAVGGGAGTAVVLMTPGEEVSLPSGAPLSIELQIALTVSVPREPA